MINFIKYDLKSNKTYLITILLIQLLGLLGALMVRFFAPLHLIFADRRLTDILFIVSIVFFLGINFTFMANFIYKDYFTKRAMLTFSLPLSIKSFILAKIIGLSCFYLASGIFLSLSLKLLAYNLGVDFIYYLAFGLVLINVLALCLNLNMAKSRFKGEVRWIDMVINLLLVILPLVVYSSLNALVIINGSLERAGGMGLSFIFPFAIGSEGLYIILTPLIYYVLVGLIMYFVNVTYIDKNLDLS